MIEAKTSPDHGQHIADQPPRVVLVHGQRECDVVIQRRDDVVAHVVGSFVALIGSQLLGIAVGRDILGIAPLVAMDDDTLARWLKPALTHYLTDPVP